MEGMGPGTHCKTCVRFTMLHGRVCGRPSPPPGTHGKTRARFTVLHGADLGEATWRVWGGRSPSKGHMGKGGAPSKDAW